MAIQLVTLGGLHSAGDTGELERLLGQQFQQLADVARQRLASLDFAGPSVHSAR